MKIANSTLDLQSSHTQTRQTEVKESLRMWVGQRPAQRGEAPPPPRTTVNISDAARARQSSDANAIEQATQDAQTQPKMQLLISLVEALTGHKVRLYQPESQGSATAGDTATGTATPAAQPPQRPAGYGVEYDRTETYSESEQTTLHASGTIKTSDGKEISFKLDLAMARQYSETSSESIRLGDAVRKTDPLVINFNGTAAQLTDQRFSFDLNSDGQNEQIATLASGSGYLALDLNADGKVNNGKELFGTASGNGFADLAKYDSDQNGWIDEADPVFKQLKVWTQDGKGGGQLASLADTGVGAISLASVATPFDVKNTANQTLGSVRNTGVVLNENGTAGTAQQIDLVA
ncbi:hypothetical protein [Ferriphaselus sp. R-1]|uniref:hypothetical protein n=1 Tax=Ferriphaselus sp. R-1 TaxID=1485544 RepID=UPI00054F7DCA|nr:hypothetical protein [Ferriphaselus sp. R-1]